MAAKSLGVSVPTRELTIRRVAAIGGAIFLSAAGALAQAKPAQFPVKSATTKPSPRTVPAPRLARMRPPAPPATPKEAAPAAKPIDLTVPVGTPLRVSLLKNVPIGKVGMPVAARVVEPVYSFNRVVIPAGSTVTGKVIQIIPAPKFRRAEAMMNGNFTPLKSAKIEFDTLVLEDGKHMPIQTDVSPGIRDVIRLVTQQAKPAKPGLVNQAKQAVGQEWHSALHDAKQVFSFHYLKQFAISELPYHHQYLHAGTVFDAELVQPLDCGKEQIAPGALTDYGDPPPANSVVHARLLTTLSSATAHKGMPVEAVIVQPLFSPRNKLLLLPEGTRLEGTVVQVHSARSLHRNGLLRIVIRRMELPSGVTTPVDASIAGLEVGRSSHIALDAEGGASIPTPKKRYLDTALSIAIATSTFDSDAGRAAGRHGGDLSNRGLAGGSGFRLVGLILGAAVQSRTMGQVLGFYGAGWSVYDHFIARGHDVVLAKNTPMTIAFGAQQPTGY